MNSNFKVIRITPKNCEHAYTSRIQYSIKQNITATLAGYLS